jgi:hypothetical protein
MDRSAVNQDEKILWQGRPAPRCYTFRLWKQALAGSVFFLVSSFWLMLALQLVADGQPWWLVCLPTPLVVASLVFGPLQILLARWSWGRIFYRLSETRLYFAQDQYLDLSEVADLKTRKYSENLASFRLDCARRKSLVLHCIEQPEVLRRLLLNHCPGLKADSGFDGQPPQG